MAAQWSAGTSRKRRARAGALVEAAARADLVERVVRPALAAGAVVVADRFLATPLVALGVAADRMRAELDARELESLAAFATGRLRPDVSVLLDRAPAGRAYVDSGPDLDAGPAPDPLPGEEHLRVRRLLTRMAAAEPRRYVVVDATSDDVAGRVLAALTPVLPVVPAAPGGAADEIIDAMVAAGPLVRPVGDPPHEGHGGTATAVAEPGTYGTP